MDKKRKKKNPERKTEPVKKKRRKNPELKIEQVKKKKVKRWSKVAAVSPLSVFNYNIAIEL